MKGSLAKLVSVAFFGSLLGRGLRYSMNVVIARGLSLEALGLFAFGMVVMKSLGVIARFGLGTTAQKFIPIYERQADERRITGVTVFTLSFPFAFGCVLSFVTFLIFKITGLISEYNSTVLVFLLGVPLVASMIVGMNITTAFKETKYSVYIRDIIQSGSAILLIGAGAYIFDSIEITLYGYIASLAIGLGAAIYYLYRLGAFQAVPEVEARELLKFSAPVVIVAVSQYVVSWTDIFMLGVFVTPTEVGLYQAAYQTSVLLLLVLSAVNSIFPPVASDLFSENRLRELDVMYTAVTRWVTYFTIFGFLFVALYATEILSLFGTTASEAQTALIILAFGQMITACTGPVGFLLTMSGNERLESLNTIVLAVLNVVLNFVLIQRFGTVGAAVATSMSLMILNAIRLVETRLILGIQPYGISYWKGGLGLLCSLLLMVFAREFLPGSLLGAIAVGGLSLLLFLAVVVGLGFDETDYALAKTLQ